jgi:hypothetical protein
MKPWPHPDPPVAAGDVDAVLTAGPTRSERAALRGWCDEVDPAAPTAAEGAARPRRPTGLPAP